MSVYLPIRLPLNTHMRLYTHTCAHSLLNSFLCGQDLHIVKVSKQLNSFLDIFFNWGMERMSQLLESSWAYQCLSSGNAARWIPSLGHIVFTWFPVMLTRRDLPSGQVGSLTALPTSVPQTTYRCFAQENPWGHPGDNASQASDTGVKKLQ